jgi:hypothetical protein
LLTEPTYLDENLPNGDYEYYVRTYFKEGCVSDSSNHVAATIEVVETCEPVNDLRAEKLDDNTILLSWTEPESNLQIDGYHVFRNEMLQNNVLLTDTTYLDENLPVGNYEYYVVAYYEMGCVADSSNHVKAEVELGIKEKGEGRKENVVLNPNPTTGKFSVFSYQFSVEKVEIYDIYGRKVFEQKEALTVLQSYDLTVLHAGVYFVRVVFEGGSCVRKLVKQ